ILEGGAALFALLLLNTAHAQLLGTPSRNFFYSGACLAGWLLGALVARSRGAPEDESYALAGAVALLGAAYLNAGLSKLAFGGLGWTQGLPLQSIIIGRDNSDVGFLGAFHAWILNAPSALRFLATATVVLELSGPLLLGGPLARRLVASGLLLMHASIFLLTRIRYWEAAALLVAFGLLPWEPVPDDGGREPFPSRRAFRTAACALAACGLLAVVHQSRRAGASAQAAVQAP
ncbi:MAG TPA: hypothetical protein VN915_06195, partial [Elusimicrobiota bacterium]|nr:hypothetical protein [Elusimicrobiota bacterium]